MLLAHQVFDDPRVPPRQQSVNAPHFSIKTVVRLVANRDYGRYAARGLANEIRKFPNPFVTRNMLRVANARIFPGLGHRLVDVSARNAQRPKKIAFAAFVHSQTRQEQFGVVDSLITEARFLENLRLEHEFDELLCALALDHELAALVENQVRLVLFASESRVW